MAAPVTERKYYFSLNLSLSSFTPAWKSSSQLYKNAKSHDSLYQKHSGLDRIFQFGLLSITWVAFSDNLSFLLFIKFIAGTIISGKAFTSCKISPVPLENKYCRHSIMWVFQPCFHQKHQLPGYWHIFSELISGPQQLLFQHKNRYYMVSSENLTSVARVPLSAVFQCWGQIDFTFVMSFWICDAKVIWKDFDITKMRAKWQTNPTVISGSFPNSKKTSHFLWNDTFHNDITKWNQFYPSFIHLSVVKM